MVGLLRDVFAIPFVLLYLFIVARERRIAYRQALAENNRCVTCEYDLTGNTSGICSECGSPTTKVVPKQNS